MEKRTQPPWVGLLLEVVVIVFSVLLALLVNEWREAGRNRAVVDRVLGTMADEVADNRAAIETALAHHIALRGQLQGLGLELVRFDLGTHPFPLHDPAGMTTAMRRTLLEMGEIVGPDFEVVQVSDTSYVMGINGASVWLIPRRDTLFVYGIDEIELRSADLRSTAWETAQATQALFHMDYRFVPLMAEIDQLHRTHDKTVSFILELLYTGSASIQSALTDLINYQRDLLTKYEAFEALNQELYGPHP